MQQNLYYLSIQIITIQYYIFLKKNTFSKTYFAINLQYYEI